MNAKFSFGIASSVALSMFKCAITSSGGSWVSHSLNDKSTKRTASEELEEFAVGVTGVLDIMGQGFLDVTHVAGFEIHRARTLAGADNGHPRFPADVVLPFVGVRMPVKLAHSAGMHRHNRGGDSCGNLECG
jgi:hypothetical protein